MKLIVLSLLLFIALVTCQVYFPSNQAFLKTRVRACGSKCTDPQETQFISNLAGALRIPASFIAKRNSTVNNEIHTDICCMENIEKKITEVYDSGSLGDVVLVSAEYVHNPNPPYKGVDEYFDMNSGNMLFAVSALLLLPVLVIVM